MAKPIFPPVIDSTMLATFRSCPQKFFRSYVEHWKPKQESIHLVAGKAYAEGLEASRRAFYQHGAEAEEAMAIGMKALVESYGDFEPGPYDTKTLDRMMGALEYYFENYPLGADGATPYVGASGKPWIEFSFAEPLPIEHPTSGMPLIYSGRADMVAEFAGAVYPVDDKTTSSLGPSWNRQWEMRSQFTGYVWACQQSGIPATGAIVRGVSILKTKYDTQQVVTYRGPHEIERWLFQTVKDIKRMIAAWEEDWWDYALDEACAAYGGCPFIRVCKSATPEAWLPQFFTQRVWDPLTRAEWTSEQWAMQWKKETPTD